MMDTVEKDGLIWPASDTICYDCIIKDIPFLREAVGYCTQTRTAIQAGGNAGMYPVELADHFDRVFTFEPEPLNFFCLERNTAHLVDVQAINGVLGDSREPVGISGWEPNCGSYEVSGDGDIQQIVIDDMELTDLDFLQLDVQGFEGRVIKGAITTIQRSHPVIMLEEGYGITPHGLLKTLGYVEVTSTRPGNKSGVRDTVYVYQA
jgi:FkbM family methyltransferase